MTTELEDLTHHFANFFKIKQKPPPEGTTRYRLRPQKGWLEEARADAFSSLIPEQISLKEGSLWSEFSAKAFRIHHIGFLSVVLAYYDGTILWLDDHESNDDFEAFVKNERLWTWLPERRDDLIALLLEAKLSYLGLPQLINTAADIPTISRSAGSPEEEQYLIEIQQNYERAANKIVPPNVFIGDDQIFNLNFFIWTAIMGRIIHARFKIGKDGLFQYQGDELTKEAGRFFVPR